MTSRPPIVVVAPDSFKGSLAAHDVADAVRDGLRRVWPDADVRRCPMADGGEGTLDAVLAALGDAAERRHTRVHGASGVPLDAAYAWLHEREVAVLEVAQVVGITDVEAMRTPVAQRSTLGVGEQVRALLDDGVRQFMIGLGGSSTNDGGAGLLAALGLELRGADGRRCEPTPLGLATLAHVDASALDARLGESTITLMSDVDNPLCGARGATAIFGPQKGVGPESVASIDADVGRFATLAEAAIGRAARERPGAGAAGGLGFALQLLGARFQSGAEVVADLIGLDDALRDAEWTITGEGRTDAQTLLGKTPWKVAQRARRAGVPVTLLSGAVDSASLRSLAEAFDGCFVLADGPITLERCLAEAGTLLADRAEALARLFDAARRRR